MSEKSNPIDEDPFEAQVEGLPALRMENAARIALATVAIALGIYSIYYAYALPYDQTQFTMLFMAGSIFVFFINDALKQKQYRNDVTRWISTGSAVLIGFAGAASVLYFFSVYADITYRPMLYHWYEYYLAWIALIAVFEGTRRAYGIEFASVIIAILLYTLYGDLIPGRFGHSGLTMDRTVEVAVLNMRGLFGNISVIGATWIAIFIIFAGFIKVYGGMRLFTNLGSVVSNRIRSGTAQLAVTTSLFMGSVTGSAAANTAATGSFTIPLMQEGGLRKETSAAIESVASSGGQMMPPVMGAAAFLMAELLPISFTDVIIYALLPALTYYICVALTVHIIAVRQGISDPEIIDSPGLSRTLINGSEIVIGLGVLIWYLVYFRYDPLVSGFYAIVATIAVYYLKKLVLEPAAVMKRGQNEEEPSTDGPETSTVDVVTSNIRSVTKTTLTGVHEGIRIVAPIMIVVAAISVILTLITTTGINQTITNLMLAYGNSLVALLLLGAAMSILFGMGMPTVAAYTLVVIFVAPGLLAFGVEEVQTHFFVFYFAVISGLTPPIAIVVAVASGIADSDFLKSCFEALPIALPGYIVPFAFVFNPELLIWTSMTPIIFPVLVIGIFALIIAILGFISEEINIVTRIVLLAFGMATIFAPTLTYQVVAAAVLFVILITHTKYVPDFGVKQFTVAGK